MSGDPNRPVLISGRWFIIHSRRGAGRRRFVRRPLSISVKYLWLLSEPEMFCLVLYTAATARVG